MPLSYSWWRHQNGNIFRVTGHLGPRRLPFNSPHKGHWRGCFVFSLISNIRAWTNGWVNNRDAGNLRPHRVHYEVNVMGWNASWRMFKKIYTLFWCSLFNSWGRVTPICVSELTSIGSDISLSPERRQATIWTNAGILLIDPEENLQWFFNQNLNIFI